MHKSNRSSLIEFTLIGMSAGFWIAKRTFDGDYSVTIPSEVDTTRVANIGTYSQIRALVYSVHVLISFLMYSALAEACKEIVPREP